MKKIVLLVIAAILGSSVYSQVDRSSSPSTQNDSLSSFENDFNGFRNDITKDYNSFKKSNDSIFLLFLERSWSELEGLPNELPSNQKPTVQPVFEDHHDNKELNNLQIEKRPVEKDEEHLQDSISGNLNPIPEPDAVFYNQNINFYGTIISLPPFGSSMPVLNSLSTKAVTDYYIQASNSDEFKNIVTRVKLNAVRQGLNDWGLSSMLMKIADFYYADNNNRNTFLWAAMLMSGINVKLGINAKNAYLLVPSDVKLYRVSYKIASKEYYALTLPGPAAGEKLFIHQADYPGNRLLFTVTINSPPLFEENPFSVYVNNDNNLALVLNKNLIEFYSNYPPCDFDVQFNTPLTPSVIKQLDALFLQLFNENTDDAITAKLLRFVQKAFKYETDQNQFGHEKYQFAEEMLYNGAGDCEDRSALFAALLRRYTKLDFIGLCYPNHITVAVNLSTCAAPALIQYKGRPFYHCDPTYLGAGCGRAMPSVIGLKPEIINNHEYDL